MRKPVPYRSLALTAILSGALASVAFAGKPNREESSAAATDVDCTGCIAAHELTGHVQQRLSDLEAKDQDLEAKDQDLQDQIDNLSFHANKRVVVKDRDGVVIGLPSEVSAGNASRSSSIWLMPPEGANRPILTGISPVGRFLKNYGSNERVIFESTDCSGQAYILSPGEVGNKPTYLVATWIAGDSIWIPDENSVLEHISRAGSTWIPGGPSGLGYCSTSYLSGGYVVPATEIRYYPPFTFEYE